MNPKEFKTDDGDLYYYFEEPWIPFENQNVLQRIFRLNRDFDKIFESLDEVEELVDDLNESEPSRSLLHKGISNIHTLIQCLEEYLYNFPDLLSEDWFVDFWQTVAAATWRAEKGVFDDKPGQLESRLREILDHTSQSPYKGIYQPFSDFIERRGWEISVHDIPEEYRNDVYEARDLYCLGYFSTSLFVLGRAVEKALLELGQLRNIRSIEAFGREKSWNEARFYSRKEALKHIQHPTGTEKMISQRQYHEISILVDYRNNVAHTDYDNLDRQEALRQIQNAFSLLQEMCEKIGELRELSDDEIEPIEGQSVN
ncbi:MAE_28990/MAE_18760 family HEPN-like nuclease [Natronorubrum texcoconense]|uniref:DUF4145 domain-containing protein n=1 Tax=Natronorubrum texcoconense TaxID=1095776 RepID=A0A1G9C5K3_9EURY|nr:MAE_28990/MAE_18760 family HEPN-like nuclease [Natronorubrum texcoconense]SDK46926.1 hypothetical protein SAMN04515672_3222 [Natronorubrum texcoconense]